MINNLFVTLSMYVYAFMLECGPACVYVIIVQLNAWCPLFV